MCNIYVYAYVHMCAGASGLRRTWQWLSILEGCFCLVILSGCQHPAVETVFLGFKMIMMIFFRLETLFYSYCLFPFRVESRLCGLSVSRIYVFMAVYFSVFCRC